MPSGGTARARAQMEPSKSAAINAAKASVMRSLGPGRKVRGAIKIQTEMRNVGGIKYWYATAECKWEDR